MGDLLKFPEKKPICPECGGHLELKWISRMCISDNMDSYETVEYVCDNCDEIIDAEDIEEYE